MFPYSARAMWTSPPYVNHPVPIGSTLPWEGGAPAPGWLICGGTLIFQCFIALLQIRPAHPSKIASNRSQLRIVERPYTLLSIPRLALTIHSTAWASLRNSEGVMPVIPLKVEKKWL